MMSFHESKRRETIEKAKKYIEDKKGTLLELREDPPMKGKKKREIHLLVQCVKKHAPWWTTVYKLTQSAPKWCKECAVEHRAEETRKVTFVNTVEYLSSLNAELVEKSYDYEKQVFHVYCNIHKGYWNEVGYEATRIFREKLNCPICRRKAQQEEKHTKLAKEKELKQKQREEEKRKREHQRCVKIEEEKRQNEGKKRQEKDIPSPPSGVDTFEYFAKYEHISNFRNGREPITLRRAKEKLELRKCINITAISPDTIQYTCPKCNNVYAERKKKIMQKTYSICSSCGRKEAIQKSHETKMKKHYQEMCEAAKKQDLVIISEKLIDRNTEIQVQSGNRVFGVSYKKFKKRGGILDPEFNRGGTSIPEIVCREIIEKLTGKAFPKGYPKGWTYPTKKGERTYSVDMYNSNDFDQPIAIEYWGLEVHEKPRETSKIYRKIDRTKHNDEKKAEYAHKTHTKLIILKGYEKLSQQEQIEDIKKHLKEANIPYDDTVAVVINKDIFPGMGYTQLVKKYCAEHKPATGTLLSEVVPTMTFPIEVKCNMHNLIFPTTASKLLDKHHWNCEECIKERRREINRLTPEKINQKLAKIPYPYPISFLRFTEGSGSHAHAEWLCPEHGVFPRTVDSVLYGSHGRYIGCDTCRDIMYPPKRKVKTK